MEVVFEAAGDLLPLPACFGAAVVVVTAAEEEDEEQHRMKVEDMYDLEVGR